MRAKIPIVLALVLATFGCKRPPTAEETIILYASAVQNQDLDQLYCLSAGASDAEELGRDDASRRAGFEAWALAQYEHYLTGRDEGWVELDGSPIPLVKLFSLGRGTYSEFDPASDVAGRGKRIPARLTFGYSQIDLSRFSPGTTFYLTGVPVGTTHPIDVPSGYREVTVEVLDSIRVEWTLVRQDAGESCPAGWAVASAVAIENTALPTRLTWIF